jgi:hypothetical protein
LLAFSSVSGDVHSHTGSMRSHTPAPTAILKCGHPCPWHDMREGGSMSLKIKN